MVYSGFALRGSRGGVWTWNLFTFVLPGRRRLCPNFRLEHIHSLCEHIYIGLNAVYYYPIHFSGNLLALGLMFQLASAFPYRLHTGPLPLSTFLYQLL